MGDTLLIVPTLRAIKETYPDSKTTAMIAASTKDIFEDSPFVDDILYYKKNRTDIFRILKYMWGIDVVLFLGPNYKASLLAWLMRVPIRLRFEWGTNKFCAYEIKRPDNPSVYYAETPLALARHININTTDLSLYIPPCKAKEQDYVDKLLKKYVFRNKFVIIAPYSSKKQKDWPENYYNQVIDFLNEKGYTSILMGGKELEQKAVLFPKAIYLDTILSPRQSTYIISLSKLMICGCSFTIHLASMTETPIIGIYGPTSPKKWAPYLNCKAITHNLPCSPCNYEKPCRFNLECIKEIYPSEVIKLVTHILSDSSSKENQRVVETM